MSKGKRRLKKTAVTALGMSMAFSNVAPLAAYAAEDDFIEDVDITDDGTKKGKTRFLGTTDLKETEADVQEDNTAEEDLVESLDELDLQDRVATPSNAPKAKLENPLGSSIGNLWPSDWSTGADVFSDGQGTESSPYLIDSVEDLRAVAEAVASNQHNGSGVYYKILSGTYDLQGDWIPIGFPCNSGGTAQAFKSHIYAEDGAEIIGMNVKSDRASEKNIGFFGEVGTGAEIIGLHIETSGTLSGADNVGILAGHAVDATIKDVHTNGKVTGKKNVGGVVGLAESGTTGSDTRNMHIENVEASDVAVYSSTSNANVGGVAGKAVNTSILDSYVTTNSGAGNHIYGTSAYAGGIVGMLKNSDVLNAYVKSGDIGSNDGYSTGGIVGGYDGGTIKVARFSGTVIKPGSSDYKYGAFIGSRVNNAGFTYGDNGKIAYLFTDTMAKAQTGICGTNAQEDNTYAKNAHIGFWHKDDDYFTIISGGTITESSGQDYFFKELEGGIMTIKDNPAIRNTDTLDHFTADRNGNPIRGYALTIIDPTVDGKTATIMTASVVDSSSKKPDVVGGSGNSDGITGAFAAGDRIFVTFDDQKTANSGGGYTFYKLDNDEAPNPSYSYYVRNNETGEWEEDPEVDPMSNDGGYYFIMPDSDTTITAIYKKVSQQATNDPENVVLELTQYRTGSREDPNIEWKATVYDKDQAASSDASIIKDALDNSWDNITIATKNAGETDLTYVNKQGNVQSSSRQFWIQTMINGGKNLTYKMNWALSNNQNNGILALSESTDGSSDPNHVRDYFTIDLSNSAIANKVSELEEKQKNEGYKDAITTKSPYYYTSQITAAVDYTQAEDETDPPVGYTNVIIKMQIVDNTNTSVNGVSLDHNTVDFNVERILTGDRRNPKTVYKVNGESVGSDATQSEFTATFTPDYFSNENVEWYLSDEPGKNVGVESGRQDDDDTLNVAISGTGAYAYRKAVLTLKGMATGSTTNGSIAAWAQSEDAAYTSQMKQNPGTEHSYKKYVKVTAKDANDNSVTDTCEVNVTFKTTDQTEILPESVVIDNENLYDYTVRYVFEGNASSDVASRTVIMENGTRDRLVNGLGQMVQAHVEPSEYEDESLGYVPFNKTVKYRLVNPSDSTLKIDDVARIDIDTGEITIRGYNDSTDKNDSGYSPWIQSLIKENKLDGTTVPVRIVAYSDKNNEVLATKDINITFIAETMDSSEALAFDNVVLAQNVMKSIAGTEISESKQWLNDDALKVTAGATGTQEKPVFTVLDDQKEATANEVTLSAGDNNNEKVVNFNRNAQWIKDIIANRKTGNSGSKLVYIRAKTANGSPISDTPVTLKFRYDGVDMEAAALTENPAGYPASSGTIANDPEETYDITKGTVKDRDITLNVVSTQGNFTIGNPETRKWSYGIVQLSNTTYTKNGVGENDAVYEISGELKKYVKVDANGVLVPIKGEWEQVISADGKNGSVSGTVTARKDSDGQTLKDSYKVTVNFRYDKAVLESHEEQFDVVYTQDSQTNDVAAHWSGDAPIQLKATIHDVSGEDVTPIWVSSDEDILKVDADGRVTVNKDTWMKEIIDNAQEYGSERIKHSDTKTATITAKHPVTGDTADTCTFTVNFRYDQAMLDSHNEVYWLIRTQTSRTINPSHVWSGNDVRHLNARVYVDPTTGNGEGAREFPDWTVDDAKLMKVDTDGNIEPIVDADWQNAIVAAGKHEGYILTAVNALSKGKEVKDSTNIRLNMFYEDVEMSENEKNLDVTIKTSGDRDNPTYTIVGDTAALSAELFSFDPNEKDIVWSCSDNNLVTVTQDGQLALVKPVDQNGKLLSGSAFQNKASKLIKDALGVSFIDTGKITSGDVIITAASKDGRMADQCVLHVNIKFIDEYVDLTDASKTVDVTITATGYSGSPNYEIKGDTINLKSILHPEDKNEKKKVYTCSEPGFLSVDNDGNIALVKPMVQQKDGTYRMAQSGEFQKLATSLIQEAIKHPWIDRDGQRAITSHDFVIKVASEDGRVYDDCPVKLNIRYIDNTYTSSGSGGSGGGGGGGGGGSTSSGKTPSGQVSRTDANLPGYVVKGGQWTQNALGKWFFTTDRTYTDEWAALQNPYAQAGQESFSWFHFNPDSTMTTGWFDDKDGERYYLNPVADNTQGRMFTGWQWIDKDGDGQAECYYFEENSNGKRGALYRNRTTPDGYSVNSDGAWTLNGVVVTRDATAVATQQASPASPAQAPSAAPLPAYVETKGEWVKRPNGKWYFSDKKAEWAALANPYADKNQEGFSWFHFGADGAMDTGWFTDKDGKVFYLNPKSDNTMGRMMLGWQLIDKDGDGMAEYYYFETESNGNRGRLYKNEKTPDGYSVNSEGQRLNPDGTVYRQRI